MARFRLIIPIYYTILLLCIGVSSVLSYFGLLSNLSWLTIPAVAVIALGLFSAGLLLQVARDKKGGFLSSARNMLTILDVPNLKEYDIRWEKVMTE